MKPVINLLFLVFLFLAAFIFLPFTFFPYSLFQEFLRTGARVILWWLKITCGLQFEFKGIENIPRGSHYIIACNHSSYFEVLLLGIVIPQPVFILKRSLCFVPIIGSYMRRMIPIDRSNHEKALKDIDMGIARHIARCPKWGPSWASFVIFPQGSRSPDNSASFKAGVSVINRKYRMPIIPTAVNSGKYCPQSSFTNAKKGTITMEFLPQINAGEVPPSQLTSVLEKRIRESLANMEDSK